MLDVDISFLVIGQVFNLLAGCWDTGKACHIMKHWDLIISPLLLGDSHPIVSLCVIANGSSWRGKELATLFYRYCICLKKKKVLWSTTGCLLQFGLISQLSSCDSVSTWWVLIFKLTTIPHVTDVYVGISASTVMVSIAFSPVA